MALVREAAIRRRNPMLHRTSTRQKRTNLLVPGPGQFKASAAVVLGHQPDQLRYAPLLGKALGMDQATRGAAQILDERNPVRLPLSGRNTLRSNRANPRTFRILDLTAQRADKRRHGPLLPAVSPSSFTCFRSYD